MVQVVMNCFHELKTKYLEEDYPLGAVGRCLGAPELRGPRPLLCLHCSRWLCLVDPPLAGSPSFHFWSSLLKSHGEDLQMHVPRAPRTRVLIQHCLEMQLADRQTDAVQINGTKPTPVPILHKSSSEKPFTSSVAEQFLKASDIEMLSGRKARECFNVRNAWVIRPRSSRIRWHNA